MRTAPSPVADGSLAKAALAKAAAIVALVACVAATALALYAITGNRVFEIVVSLGLAWLGWRKAYARRAEPPLVARCASAVAAIVFALIIGVDTFFAPPGAGSPLGFASVQIAVCLALLPALVMSAFRPSSIGWRAA